MPGQVKNLLEMVFDRLTVIEFVGIRAKKAYWRCICQCGQEVILPGKSLKSPNFHSCGCYLKECRVKHGLARSPEYQAWADMKARCLDPNNRRYSAYGGRGVMVCDQWLTFTGFFDDMGPRPTPKHSLERANNNGDYCPENCVWATMKSQGRNRRDNHLVTFLGKTLCVTEWSELIGIPRHILYTRLKAGWPVERVLLENPQRKTQKKKLP